MTMIGARGGMRVVPGVYAAVAAFALLGIAGCTPGQDNDNGDADGQGSGNGRAMSFELAAADTDAVKMNVPDKPVATAKASTAGMVFELYSLQRSDKVVNVVFAMHNTGEEEVEAKGAVYDLDEDPDPLHTNASNVSLVDTKGLKEYRSFITKEHDSSRRNCLCSMTYDNFDTDDYAPDERQFFVVQVAAPPASVTSVTVLAHVASLPGQKIEG